MSRPRVFAVCVVLLLVSGCLCRPKDDDSHGTPNAASAGTSSTSRSSRLQKPTQVLNTGFDEIVVESNLQVHNRVGSKNKSKIMLPSNSTTQAHKSRSLVV
ncbi:uncharacterized protein LOC126835685 [Adelges cooleyi]|uniref:uncharacterized protein LOC126835685 n=1 Tax=Adelges cooleyi TaxID=133065 RepID=UPI0021805EDB|nr:uncharacterized protein LOC126835685 [Adelges cooleyi]